LLVGRGRFSLLTTDRLWAVRQEVNTTTTRYRHIKSMAETNSAMLRRHVQEGLARIERQELLIAHLERRGQTNLLPQARQLLDTMNEFQTEAEAHLAETWSRL